MNVITPEMTVNGIKSHLTGDIGHITFGYLRSLLNSYLFTVGPTCAISQILAVKNIVHICYDRKLERSHLL